MQPILGSAEHWHFLSSVSCIKPMLWPISWDMVDATSAAWSPWSFWREKTHYYIILNYTRLIIFGQVEAAQLSHEQRCKSWLFKKPEMPMKALRSLEFSIFLYIQQLMKKTRIQLKPDEKTWFRFKPEDWHLWMNRFHKITWQLKIRFQ